MLHSRAALCLRHGFLISISSCDCVSQRFCVCSNKGESSPDAMPAQSGWCICAQIRAWAMLAWPASDKAISCVYTNAAYILWWRSSAALTNVEDTLFDAYSRFWKFTLNGLPCKLGLVCSEQLWHAHVHTFTAYITGTLTVDQHYVPWSRHTH